MKWRIDKRPSGWVIEYKKSLFSSWKIIQNSRKFSFEPFTDKIFSNKKEASKQMVKLINRYG